MLRRRENCGLFQRCFRPAINELEELVTPMVLLFRWVTNAFEDVVELTGEVLQGLVPATIRGG